MGRCNVVWVPVNDTEVEPPAVGDTRRRVEDSRMQPVGDIVEPADTVAGDSRAWEPEQPLERTAVVVGSG